MGARSRFWFEVLVGAAVCRSAGNVNRNEAAGGDAPMPIVPGKPASVIDIQVLLFLNGVHPLLDGH
jgi:hypothetical protein